MTTKEFADRLGIAKITIIKYRCDGRLVPEHKYANGTYNYSEEDIEKAKEIYGRKTLRENPIVFNWKKLENSYIDTDILENVSDKDLHELQRVFSMYDLLLKEEIERRNTI